MTDKEQARQQIVNLVGKFRALSPRQRSAYNEQETRLHFILPLFRALGWDTESPADMTAEEQISRGFVDFGFYLDGVPRFYLETKKIPEDINKPQWAKQAINYSWLKGVTWAVLTDFEGLKVFNAEWQEPNPQQAVFLDLRCEHYPNGAFDQLWLLSKESIRAGEIDRVAEQFGKKAKKRPVNEILLAQMTNWRKELFKEIRQFGETLWAQDARAIDNAVQRFLDRLIFIRTVEDREIEPNRLQALVRQYKDGTKKGKDLFADLQALFRELDGVYNATLFAESTIDHVSIHNPDLLAGIIGGLYDVPKHYAKYDFNAIDADVLGAVYEQYLGWKAQDPTGQDALNVGKREKRKAQGIYYTPKFVVRYIVQNTLGRLLEEGRDPHTIRVLDPACGSGSFLIEAFDVLDRWLAQHEPDVTARERRRRILNENLYGVDLDEQAVEVARLNLLLRAAGERDKLPMLTHIRRGNSLIDDPAVAGDAAFKWEEEFADVFKAGGFDVVIGNPPYVRMEGFKEAKPYLRERYTTHAKRLDLYGYFIERELELLKHSGRFGMIVSNKFLKAQYGKGLRKYITANSQIESLVDLAGLPVFREATVRTIIIISCRAQVGTKTEFTYTPVMAATQYEQVEKNGVPLQNIVSTIGYPVQKTQLQENTWNFARADESAILEKIKSRGMALADYLKPLPICMGVKSGLTGAFVIGPEIRRAILAKNPKADAIIKPLLNGRDIRCYRVDWDNKYLIYTYHGIDISHYPAVEAYLKPYQQQLEQRATQQAWYELQQPQFNYAQYMDAPKIIFPDIGTETRFALDRTGYYGSNTTYFLPIADLYLLGLLNSSVANFYFKQVCAALEGTGEAYLRFFGQYLEGMPIIAMNRTENPADAARHDQMVTLVEKMLQLQQEYAAMTAFDDRRHVLAEKIAQLDREIDALVYKLYGLTAEEIAIVES